MKQKHLMYKPLAEKTKGGNQRGQKSGKKALVRKEKEGNKDASPAISKLVERMFKYKADHKTPRRKNVDQNY